MLRGAGEFLGLRQHGKSQTITGEKLTLEMIASARQIADSLSEEEKESIVKSASKASLDILGNVTLN
jgi:transcription-repair coupling factor (superfamily II helicase)